VISNKVHHHLPAEARARLCVSDNVLVEKMKRRQRKRSKKILVLEAIKVGWHALLCFATFFIMHKCCSLLCFAFQLYHLVVVFDFLYPTLLFFLL